MDSSWIRSGTTIRLPFQTAKELEVHIRLMKHWVSMQFFMTKGTPSESRVAIQEYLCEANASVPQFKFLLKDQRVIMQVDIPKNQCSEPYSMSVFRAALKYAQHQIENISLLVSNPSVATLYVSVKNQLELGNGNEFADDEDFAIEILRDNASSLS